MSPSVNVSNFAIESSGSRVARYSHNTERVLALQAEMARLTPDRTSSGDRSPLRATWTVMVAPDREPASSITAARAARIRDICSYGHNLHCRFPAR